MCSCRIQNSFPRVILKELGALNVRSVSVNWWWQAGQPATCSPTATNSSTARARTQKRFNCDIGMCSVIEQLLRRLSSPINLRREFVPRIPLIGGSIFVEGQFLLRQIVFGVKTPLS